MNSCCIQPGFVLCRIFVVVVQLLSRVRLFVTGWTAASRLLCPPICFTSPRKSKEINTGALREFRKIPEFLSLPKKGRDEQVIDQETLHGGIL